MTKKELDGALQIWFAARDIKVAKIDAVVLPKDGSHYDSWLNELYALCDTTADAEGTSVHRVQQGFSAFDDSMVSISLSTALALVMVRYRDDHNTIHRLVYRIKKRSINALWNTLLAYCKPGEATGFVIPTEQEAIDSLIQRWASVWFSLSGVTWLQGCSPTLPGQPTNGPVPGILGRKLTVSLTQRDDAVNPVPMYVWINFTTGTVRLGYLSDGNITWAWFSVPNPEELAAVARFSGYNDAPEITSIGTSCDPVSIVETTYGQAGTGMLYTLAPDEQSITSTELAPPPEVIDIEPTVIHAPVIPIDAGAKLETDMVPVYKLSLMPIHEAEVALGIRDTHRVGMEAVWQPLMNAGLLMQTANFDERVEMMRTPIRALAALVDGKFDVYTDIPGVTDAMLVTLMTELGGDDRSVWPLATIRDTIRSRGLDVATRMVV